MKSRLFNSFLFLTILSLGLSTACDRKPARRADFVFINRGDIITLDLNQMSYAQDFRLTYAIREGLYVPAPVTLIPEPAGAASSELSEDKKVWTFHLRPEAKWSNGDPVTAKDYVFSWRRMLEEPGEYTYLFYYIKNAKEYEDSYTAGKPIDFKTVGIEAIDDLTFRVTLINPVNYFLELAAFPPFYPRNEKSMLPFKQMLDNGHYTYDPRYTRPPNAVTNGPFELKQWVFKQYIWLEKSPNYWDKDRIKLNNIEMRVTENTLSQFLQYESKDVDWIADVPADLAAELKEKGRKDLRTSTGFTTAFLTFYVKDKLPQQILGGAVNPLADIRVRQALTMAIDKQFIVDQITRMDEKVATTYFPPGTLPGFDCLPGLPFDVAKAKKLLADAGYPDGKGFPELPILFNTENTTRSRICQYLKQQWKKNLGIDIEIEGIEGKIYRSRVTDKQYAIAIAAWTGDYPDVTTFTDKYLSDSLQNDCGWINKEYDSLCDQATREIDAAKRLALLQKAEALLDTEVPIVPLFHMTNVSMNRDGILGIEPNPRGVTVFKGISIQH